MSDITHDHLTALGDRITQKIEREVTLARDEHEKSIRGVYRRIDELKTSQRDDRERVDEIDRNVVALRTEQKQHADRIEQCEADCGDHGRELARLDERIARSVGATSPVAKTLLTPTQRRSLMKWALTALGTGAVALLEALRRAYSGGAPTL